MNIYSNFWIGLNLILLTFFVSTFIQAGTDLKIEAIAVKFQFDKEAGAARVLLGKEKSYGYGKGSVIHTEKLSSGNMAVYILTNSHVWNYGGELDLIRKATSRMDLNVLRTPTAWIKHYPAYKFQFFNNGTKLPMNYRLVIPDDQDVTYYPHDSWLNYQTWGQHSIRATDLGAAVLIDCFEIDKKTKILNGLDKLMIEKGLTQMTLG